MNTARPRHALSIGSNACVKACGLDIGLVVDVKIRNAASSMHHARGSVLDQDVNVQEIARGSFGFDRSCP
jgi:hypothetical protein